ncbi:MAG: rhs protein [Pseudomonadota bacterium]
MNWKKYIYDTAKPEDDGQISKTSAKAAYNDLANLQIMCRSCNAKKNGPKNVFD